MLPTARGPLAAIPLPARENGAHCRFDHRGSPCARERRARVRGCGRFTNGTTDAIYNRTLLLANPQLAKVITETIGDGWMASRTPEGGASRFATSEWLRPAVRLS